MRQIGNYTISGIIALESGMRIGGSDDVLQIGGTDLTCIKDPATGRPYIPGSSIKGKMRSSLEKILERTWRNEGHEPCGCGKTDCPICRIFGPHKNTRHELGPTRIRVHDAPLIEDSSFAIEMKTESTNLRDTGTAKHPRTVERVAPGARFRLRIDLVEYDMDGNFAYVKADGTRATGKSALLAVIDHGIDLLINGGLGSGTGKGYGKISIEDIKWEKVERTQRISIP